MVNLIKNAKNVDNRINIILKLDNKVAEVAIKDNFFRNLTIAENISFMSKKNWGKSLQKK